MYLHDGVRRIQEIWREPAPGNGSEGGQNQNQGPPTYVDYTAREYVHSPGYVDEFVCEIDTDSAAGPSGAFWWVLQDANYNVVALISDGDGAGGVGSGGTTRGEVARQYAWSPYGELLRADIFDTSAPMSRLGHQGLFHDRLDADILTEPMVALADQLVQDTNRTLSPRLGRFLQRDPNLTGLGVLASMNFGGATIGADPQGIDGGQLFATGGNLYEYLGSSPLERNDPAGLFPTLGGMLTKLGVTVQIAGTYGGAACGGWSAGKRLAEWDAGMISTRDLAIGLLADAITAGGFWAVGKGVGWALGWAGGKVAGMAAARAGQWLKDTGYMSRRARAYQHRITGRGDEYYELNGVKFDGFKSGALQDAKGPGYADFVGKDGAFRLPKVEQKLIDEAYRQKAAAQGAPIIWDVAEKKAYDAMRKAGIDKIVTTLRHTPP